MTKTGFLVTAFLWGFVFFANLPVHAASTYEILMKGMTPETQVPVLCEILLANNPNQYLAPVEVLFDLEMGSYDLMNRHLHSEKLKSSHHFNRETGYPISAFVVNVSDLNTTDVLYCVVPHRQGPQIFSLADLHEVSGGRFQYDYDKDSSRVITLPKRIYGQAKLDKLRLVVSVYFAHSENEQPFLIIRTLPFLPKGQSVVFPGLKSTKPLHTWVGLQREVARNSFGLESKLQTNQALDEGAYRNE